MAVELVLDASVSLAWFLKETAERAAYAAAVNAPAAEGTRPAYAAKPATIRAMCDHPIRNLCRR